MLDLVKRWTVIACGAALSAGCGDLVGVDFGAAHLGSISASPDATPGMDGGGGSPDASSKDARGDSGTKHGDAAASDAGKKPDGAPAGCTPKTCEALHVTCGDHDDGCGGITKCASCGSQESCIDGACKCQPTTCPALNATCGTENDGCGAALDCGACLASQVCADNACACKPTTCAAMGFNCGTIPDGCGNTLDCSQATGCSFGTVCGGGGPNVCGPAACTPTTCAANGKNCGTISDGCGATLDCGSGCMAPETCAGAGVANVCGCTPITCATLGASCGTPPDGCGGTLNCGTTCPTDDTCAGGGTPYVCGCTPTTCSALGAKCGAPSNACGGTLSCGTCASPQVCYDSACCTPRICAVCNEGSIPNGCGGVAICPICTCFGVGTEITMADRSHRAIESIRVGEHVLSYDTDRAAWVSSTITRTMSHAPEEGTGIFIIVNGGLRLTSNHPVWANGRATAAEELHVGDPIVVLSPDGIPVTTNVRSLDRVESHEVTYDLDVDGPGNFVAGNIVVVHKVDPP